MKNTEFNSKDELQIIEIVAAINEAPHLASYIYKQVKKEYPHLLAEVKKRVKD